MDLGNSIRSLGLSHFKAAFPVNVQSIRAMRLSTAMSGLFVLLSIPVLIFILVYNYRQNAAAINATLNDVVAKTKQASIEHAENLINPVAATLSLLAAVAAEDPSAFRKDGSRELLYQSLEPLRVCRRLQLLRGWSHDKQDHEQIFTRGPGPCGSDGSGSRERAPIALGGSDIDCDQDRLHAADAA